MYILVRITEYPGSAIYEWAKENAQREVNFNDLPERVRSTFTECMKRHGRTKEKGSVLCGVGDGYAWFRGETRAV